MPTVVTDTLVEPSVIYAFVLALAFVGVVGTPLSIALARLLRVVDEPGGRRIHARPVPLLGGIGIVVGVLLGTAPNLPLNDAFTAILIGAVLMCALGAIDDAVQLSPAVKLTGQVACTLLPIREGVTIDQFTVPILGAVDLGPAAAPVTVIFIVAIANVVNFIDGLDGLAAGLGAVAAGTFAVLAVSLDRGTTAVLAAAVAGACLGFLGWNFHPARIFMGDSGALPLGYLLATMSIAGVMKTAAALSVVFPLVVLLVPIVDTSFVVLKRLKYGRPISAADQNHLHHRMLRLGYSQRRAALSLYAWCAVLAGFALAVRFLDYRTPAGDWHLWPTVALAAIGAVAVSASLYVVYALEILKYRHVRLIGFARRVDVGGEVPLSAHRRSEQRDEVASGS